MRFSVSLPAVAFPFAVVVPLMLFATPRAARAQVTAYTSLASFNAAATTTQLFTFEGIAGAGAGTTTPNLSPLTVSVSGGTDPNYYVFDGGFGGGGFSLNGSATLVAGLGQNTSLPTVTLAFGGPVTAFGTEIGFRSNSGSGTLINSFTAQLFNGATAVGGPYQSVPFGTAFFGFTSTVAFDRIRLTSNNTTFDPYQVYDNVRVGSVRAAAAPEPGTLALVGMGFVAGRLRRRETVRRREARLKA